MASTNRCTECGAVAADKDGLCKACRIREKEGEEAYREYMARLGRRGAHSFHASRRKAGLEPDDLPPLDSPQAAETWAEVVGRAVATGRLSHTQGKAVASLLREWRQSHDAGSVRDRIEALQDQFAELKGADLKRLK